MTKHEIEMKNDGREDKGTLKEEGTGQQCRLKEKKEQN